MVCHGVALLSLQVTIYIAFITRACPCGESLHKFYTITNIQMRFKCVHFECIFGTASFEMRFIHRQLMDVSEPVSP